MHLKTIISLKFTLIFLSVSQPIFPYFFKYIYFFSVNPHFQLMSVFQGEPTFVGGKMWVHCLTGPA